MIYESLRHQEGNQNITRVGWKWRPNKSKSIEHNSDNSKMKF